MKDKRFLSGIAISVAWIAFAACMLLSYPHPKELNAWGDFFAGFFAPLAFLWLVIGYLQQGEELKHSTDALKLQAEELRNSVIQQSELVAVSREQMKQEFDALQEERDLRRDAARPKFVPQGGGSSSSSGITTHKVRISNVGNTATNLSISFDPPVQPQSSLNHALVPRNGIIELALRFTLTTPSIVSMKYIDADGFPGEVQFSVQAPSGGGLLLGDARRIL